MRSPAAPEGRLTAVRVLFLCHGHPALVPGGTEIVAHDLFRAMRERDGCAALFVGCVSPLHRSFETGSRLQTLGRTSDEMLLWVGASDAFMLAQTETAGFAAALSEVLLSFRPDVVHFHHLSRLGLEAVLLVRRLLPAARIVLTLHDYAAICANEGLMRRPSGQLCRQASADACRACLPHIAHARHAARRRHLQAMLRHVDRFVAPSAFLRQRYLDWGIAADRIALIRNGVPAQPPAPAAARPRTSFAFFGNIAPHKGVLVALEAARLLAADGLDFALRIHGEMHFQPEAFRADFARGLAAAGPRVAWSGGYSRDELPGLMAAVDWVLVPSIWWENAPLVILEALQHRRPVLCPDIGGMAELVGRGGQHFSMGNAHDLARTMRRVMATRGLWRRLVNALPGPPSLDQTAGQHLDLYRALLRNEEAVSA